jgi:hypothetical protein
MYKTLLEYLAQKLAEDTKKYTAEFFAKTLSDLKPDALVTTVEANKHLSDAQKSQIVYILSAQAGLETSYLR